MGKLKFPFSTEIKVRFRDVDMMRHVNHAVYLSYLEEARSDFWEYLFGDEPEFRKASFIIASLSIHYRAQAYFRDRLTLSIGVTRLGNSSFTFAYEVRRKGTGELIVECESIQVMFKYRENKPFPIPVRMRDIFQERGMVRKMKEGDEDDQEG